MTGADGTDERAAEGIADQSVGVAVPEDHVAAFVAEAFEDPERSTAWNEAVAEAVADDARDAWEALTAAEQVRELLAMADRYDERAVDRLAEIPTDRDEPTGRIDDLFAEAARCRRNADRLRDAVADAYAEGRVDDDALVEAVETYGFETETVAERERLLETVTNAYGYDFRPYGGTLMEDGDEAGGSHDHW